MMNFKQIKMKQEIIIKPTIEWGKEKGDEISAIMESKFEIIKKYANLIQDETGIPVMLMNFHVVAIQGEFK